MVKYLCFRMRQTKAIISVQILQVWSLYNSFFKKNIIVSSRLYFVMITVKMMIKIC